MTSQDNAPERKDPGAVGNQIYVIYIILTVVLFFGLCLLAYLGYKNDWIPNRGIS